MAPLSFVALSEFSNLNKKQDNEVHLMAKFVAGEIEQENRNPLAISSVLDVSGSMGGPKLDSLKKTMKKLIKNLSKHDYLGIVIFATRVREVMKPLPMDAKGKEKAYTVIEALEADDCTNMSGGILKGFEQFQKMDLPPIRIKPENRTQALEIDEKTNEVDYIRRLLLFTDGLANEGIRADDHKGFEKLVKTTPKNVTISTFGYGDNYDEELLNLIADKAKGEAHHITDDESMSSSFARELGGLVSCIGQGLKMEFEMNADNEIVEVISDNYEHSLSSDKKLLTIEIPDIYAGESMRTAIKVRIPKPGKGVAGAAREFRVATVSGECVNLKTMEKESFEEKVMVNFVTASNADKKPNKEVAEYAGMLKTAKASRQAMDLADKGNVKGAGMVLADCLKSFSHVESDKLSAFRADMEEMQQNFASQSMYLSNRKSLRNVTRGLSNQRAKDTATEAYYGTKTQSEMIQSFSEDEDEKE